MKVFVCQKVKVLVPGGYLAVPGGYLIVPGGYLMVPGGYLMVPGGYLMVPRGYLNKGVLLSCFGQLKIIARLCLLCSLFNIASSQLKTLLSHPFSKHIGITLMTNM